MPMKPNKFLFAGLLAAAIVTGCGTSDQPVAGEDHSQHQTQGGTTQKGHPAGEQAEAYKTLKVGEQVKLKAIGDIQEATASKSDLPKFLMQKNSKIVDSYKAAVENLDVLQYIPCYCGCGDHAGHKNNAECFVKDIRPDGVVVWDDHGTRCDTCMNIALKSAEMKKQGKSVQEIRKFIDEKYKEGYAKPTQTPMPQ
jgi:hypothetical protein